MGACRYYAIKEGEWGCSIVFIFAWKVGVEMLKNDYTGVGGSKSGRNVIAEYVNSPLCEGNYSSSFNFKRFPVILH